MIKFFLVLAAAFMAVYVGEEFFDLGNIPLWVDGYSLLGGIVSLLIAAVCGIFRWCLSGGDHGNNANATCPPGRHPY
jgi:hypothetical protein